MSRFRRITAIAITLTGLAIAAACVAAIGHAPDPSPAPSATLPPSSPSTSTPPVSEPTAPTGDYFTVLGTAQRLYEPAQTGVVEYCPVDRLGRAVCAYGDLTSSQRRAAEARGREEITVAPAGWGHNRTVTIPAAPGVAGSASYRGWFWNRSHLVADSLGGAASLQNLITGTRPQNVGSTKIDGQYAGGMAYAETRARAYLDSHNGDACPLYYAAAPTYAGDALVPVSVIVDMRSCDGALDERVEISNTAYGWAIDYRTGSFVPVS